MMAIYNTIFCCACFCLHRTAVSCSLLHGELSNSASKPHPHHRSQTREEYLLLYAFTYLFTISITAQFDTVIFHSICAAPASLNYQVFVIMFHTFFCLSHYQSEKKSRCDLQQITYESFCCTFIQQ